MKIYDIGCNLGSKQGDEETQPLATLFKQSLFVKHSYFWLQSVVFTFSFKACYVYFVFIKHLGPKKLYFLRKDLVLKKNIPKFNSLPPKAI